MKLKTILLLAILSLLNCGKSFSGTWKCTGEIKHLEFRGGENVVVDLGGMKAPVTYKYEDGFLYLYASGGTLSFKLKDSATLVGESMGINGSVCSKDK